FSDGHLATVKGYEFYGAMAKTYSKMKDESFRRKATDFYVKIQIVGTPDECIQQVAELQRLTGVDHLATEFGYGGLPHEQARLNMRSSPHALMAGRQRRTGVDPLATEFGYGGMPHEQAELNMRMFGDRVMPVLQRDPAFASHAKPANGGGHSATPGAGIFAPA